MVIFHSYVKLPEGIFQDCHRPKKNGFNVSCKTELSPSVNMIYMFHARKLENTTMLNKGYRLHKSD